MKLIALSQGYFAKVDDSDFDRLDQVKWHVNILKGKPYARHNKFGYMHRFILASKPGDYADHKFGDTLNNQRYNLRNCTQGENSRGFKTKQTGTTSQFIGVSWYKRYKCWRAYIVLDNKQKHLGYFPNEKVAGLRYDIEARKLFGDLATLNFPELNEPLQD